MCPAPSHSAGADPLPNTRVPQTVRTLTGHADHRPEPGRQRLGETAAAGKLGSRRRPALRKLSRARALGAASLCQPAAPPTDPQQPRRGRRATARARPGPFAPPRPRPAGPSEPRLRVASPRALASSRRATRVLISRKHYAPNFPTKNASFSFSAPFPPLSRRKDVEPSFSRGQPEGRLYHPHLQKRPE